jgi:type I restriction enzyme R subunit
MKHGERQPMSQTFTESVVEEAALAWLEALGYGIAHGRRSSRRSAAATMAEWCWRIDCGGAGPTESEGAGQRHRGSVSQADDSRFARPQVGGNHAMHRFAGRGPLPVEFSTPGRLDGRRHRSRNRLRQAGRNDFLAVNQLTVVENKHERRPDILLYVNGLPLAVIELKNAADENATLWGAFNNCRLQAASPDAVPWNAVLGRLGRRAGPHRHTDGRPRAVHPWRTIGGEELAPAAMPQLQVVLEGVFEKARLLQLVRHSSCSRTRGAASSPRRCRLSPVPRRQPRAGGDAQGRQGPTGDRRVGVVWHTQGSGKSLTMAFYAGRVILNRR